MPRIKVVHLITLLELGGAQGNTLYTVKNLDRQKFEVELWCGQGAFWDQYVETDEFLCKRVQRLKYLVRPLSPLYDLLAIIEIWRHLRKTRPAILHTHSSKAGIVGRMAAWLAGVPVVIHTFHGFGFNQEQKVWTYWGFVYIERLCALMSTKLIFVSRANWQQALRLKIGAEKKYGLIRSGIPLKKIQSEAKNKPPIEIRQLLGLKKASKVITTISAFKPQKNLPDFIWIANRLINRGFDVEFLMVGDGQLREHLIQTATDLGIRQHVHFLGWRHDVPSLLSISTLFVLTSLWEGLPRSLLEALSLGIPAVCYATDGITDLLPHGAGYVVPQKDIDGLLEKIILLLTDDRLYQEKSLEARQLIGIEFDIDHMVQQQENLYLSLDKNKGIN